MEINSKTRGLEVTRNTQRVFLCLDPANANDCDKLTADLLDMESGMDCAVYWLDKTGEGIDIELLRNLLQHKTQLLVLWITVELLQSLSVGCKPKEYEIARQLDIPILPIAADGKLFDYMADLKLEEGLIHGLARSDCEYNAKLKAQLEYFLASREVMDEIEAKAFTASVFLSYRKDDIEHVDAFMNRLHNLPGLMAVSVWYDNDLTAGRIFDEEIRESIDKADVFVLLVTPTLLKKNRRGEDNYVVSSEYPYAVEQGKTIIAVEQAPLDDTERMLYYAMFPDAGEPVNLCIYDDKMGRFYKKLGDSAILNQFESEQCYLLGLAYIKRYRVERNIDRAIYLLDTAAEYSNNIRASDMLGVHYYNRMEFQKALQYFEKSVRLCEEVYGTDSETTGKAYRVLASAYQRTGDTSQAKTYFRKATDVLNKKEILEDLGYAKVVTIQSHDSGDEATDAWIASQRGYHVEPGSSVFHQFDDDENAQALNQYQKILLRADAESLEAADAMHDIACIYGNRGAHEQAIQFFKQAVEIYEKNYDTYHHSTANAYKNLAMAMWRDTFVVSEQEEIIKIFQKAYDIYLQTGMPQPETEQAATGLVDALLSVGNAHYNVQQKTKTVLEYYQRAWDIHVKVFSADDAFAAKICMKLGVVHYRLDNNRLALQWCEKALKINERVVENEYQDTLEIYSALAEVSAYLKRYDEALDYYQKVFSQEDVLGASHRIIRKTRQSFELYRTNHGGFRKALKKKGLA